jgi:hypothetical protein
MGQILNSDEARALLQIACDNAGGPSALARKLGITIGAVSGQLHGHARICGRVARHLGIQMKRQTTISYEVLQND